ncbi:MULTISPECIES: inositol-3-phosphate synthase [Acetivibrio]|jgi:myo-inositol-1-phosphate synthase|uniref:Inositol-1-phosphate synthase n=1 Tax=Acetivibrio straminisolvens JCM 21531 TaxID=1294263 RepID=W4V5R1_9FIRM|nr:MULTISPECIES: inositol-3-phosphate synthase [Acetivibrio]GAE88502.1 inositol-1-phosphate synthase [Acetivibrio straminisolvens JCM 21531]
MTELELLLNYNQLLASSFFITFCALSEAKGMANKMKICIIGVKGGISTVTMTGIFKSKINGTQVDALLTNTELFKDIPLIDTNSFEFGGFDVRAEGMVESAIIGDQNDIFHIQYDKEVQKCLSEVQVFKGVCINGGTAIEDIGTSESRKNCNNLAEAVDHIKKELLAFKGNDDCIMVNLASTEATIRMNENHSSIDNFRRAIELNECNITPGQLYAYCAIDEGIPYINFTPSICADFPALEELALERKVPIAGKDGKTGETLLKTVLSELFRVRNLNVEMWYGTNILGNLDGKVLDYGDNKETKIASKKQVLQKCLGYSPDCKVRIDYMKPMGDNKVAWDYILFSGFGGAKMNMTFTWQGIDSFLAAPLVIDLIRLTQYAWKKESYGTQSQFSLFFKTPLGTDVNMTSDQYRILKDWLESTK